MYNLKLSVYLCYQLITVVSANRAEHYSLVSLI